MFVFNVTLFQSATQRLTESTTRLMISFSVTVSAVLLYCLAKVFRKNSWHKIAVVPV